VTETAVLGSLDPAAPNPFGPGSVIRRVVGEPIVYLLYPRALVMDVAHGSVGAAVADHSRFRQQPLRRLWATTDAALRLVFGEGQEPMGAARQIYRFHDGIHGPVAVDGAPDKVRYTAHDASLLLWVWATLVDSCDVAFTRWVRPYDPAEAESFYQDMCAFARFFGIPVAMIPPDRTAFSRYLDEMLDDPRLGSSATSARMARDILWLRPWFVAPASSAVRILNIGTLDPRLARRLDLCLTPAERRRFDRLDGLLRRHYARLPSRRTSAAYGYLNLRRLVARPAWQEG
jgi:uncharacterized protein (DUF2236 family)